MQYAATFDPNAPIQVAYNTPLGVYTRKADTGPRLKLVVRPDKLEKAGLDAKTTATKVRSFGTATIAEWKKYTDGGGKPHPDRPTLDNVKVAVKMLGQGEALHWPYDFGISCLKRKFPNRSLSSQEVSQQKPLF